MARPWRRAVEMGAILAGTSGTYVLSIDQGTTGSTILIVDMTTPSRPEVIGRATVDFPQHYPKTGWVEHDLEEIWQSVGHATRGAVEKARLAKPDFSEKRIVAIGISNQRETTCIFERKTGRPIARAIVWQCKRSTNICSRLKKEGHEALFKERTGLVLDPYFSGTKVTWIMENATEIAREIQNGRAVIGTIDTYLIARLTGGATFATDASNASRTLAYDIGTGQWSPELMKILKIPGLGVLPEVRDSAGSFGVTKGLDFLPDGIPITGVLGDQQAALAGQACFEVGEAKCTYGTGAFLLLNLGERKLPSSHGMLTTVAWSLQGRLSYAFEGSAFVAGAAVQFLRDQMHFLQSAAESEVMASGAVASPEVYFVPALVGLGAPYWDPKAQGAFLGLTRGTTKAQIVRASLEGMAFQVKDLLQAMHKDCGHAIKVLRVDGGAAANNLLMQAQADFAATVVDRPANLETTAFGAALFAALGVQIYENLGQLSLARQTERLFQPTTNPDEKKKIENQLKGWERAVRAVQVFAGTL